MSLESRVGRLIFFFFSVTTLLSFQWTYFCLANFHSHDFSWEASLETLLQCQQSVFWVRISITLMNQRIERQQPFWGQLTFIFVGRKNHKIITLRMFFHVLLATIYYGPNMSLSMLEAENIKKQIIGLGRSVVGNTCRVSMRTWI